MKHFALILLSFLSVLGILDSPRILNACTCLGISVDTAYAQAEVVFLGRVTKCELKSDYRGDNKLVHRASQYKLATLVVSRSWKGALDSLVQVTTASEGSMCGVGFAVGEKYLVYGVHVQGRLSTNICARSTLESYATEDLSILNKKYSRDSN